MTDIKTIIDQIDSSEGSTIKLKLSAWPFSRDIIKAICTNNKVSYKVERVTKDHEEFTLGTFEHSKPLIKKVIKYINKEARTSGNHFTSERNKVVSRMIAKYFPDQVDELDQLEAEVKQTQIKAKIKEEIKKPAPKTEIKVEKIHISKEQMDKAKKEVDKPKNIVSRKNPGSDYVKNGKDSHGIQKWKLRA